MNNATPNQDFFRTADIWLIAFLIASGEKYLYIDRQINEGKSKVFFFFPLDVEELAHDFFNGEKIPAIALKDAVGRVKSILYDF